MRLIYKFASRSRPSKFFACLDNITENASHPDYQMLATLDIDDSTMFNEQVKERLKGYPKVKAYWGVSKSKIDAINRDMAFADEWDILINMSDDMVFIQKGFDLQIIEDFKEHGLDTLMHYPDQQAGPALITMAIMGREYYDRFGYIYHPEYKSLFCDNEQQEVAKALGRYRYVKKRLFDHRHPAWGFENDEQYKFTESFHNVDKETFFKRKSLAFP